MLEELRLTGTLALSILTSAAMVPLAIRLARRTAFLDHPVGYKGHGRATPYLGGAAVMAAFSVSALALGGVGTRFWAILGCALTLFAVGTTDDRVNLGPGLRLAVEVAIAIVLWSFGVGWSVFGEPTADLLLTILWVVGIVNAFNLMDNMDGATSSVAATSSAGVAALALVQGDTQLAVLMLALTGACVGFLPFNLARPARIFLGDGGSMPIGLLIAAAIMAMPFHASANWVALLVGAPLVGLVILDTTLVMISRTRRGTPLLTGGRDHLTHRLREQLGSAQLVALTLALVQAALCAIALGVSQAGHAAVLSAAVLLMLTGASAIYALEAPRRETLVDAGPSPLAVPEEQYV